MLGKKAEPFVIRDRPICLMERIRLRLVCDTNRVSDMRQLAQNPSEMAVFATHTLPRWRVRVKECRKWLRHSEF